MSILNWHCESPLLLHLARTSSSWRHRRDSLLKSVLSMTENKRSGHIDQLKETMEVSHRSYEQHHKLINLSHLAVAQERDRTSAKIDRR
jgi:hypothetical protein